MKRKTYKRLINRINRETFMREMSEKLANQLIPKAAKAEFYKKRFQDFGTNVETTEPGSGKFVVCEKWSLRWEPYGVYKKFPGTINEEDVEQIKKELAEKIAGALIENNLIQFFVKEADDFGPLTEFATIGAKLFVVPWEQMPHKRTIELKKYVDDTLEEDVHGL